MRVSRKNLIQKIIFTVCVLLFNQFDSRATTLIVSPTHKTSSADLGTHDSVRFTINYNSPSFTADQDTVLNSVLVDSTSFWGSGGLAVSNASSLTVNGDIGDSGHRLNAYSPRNSGGNNLIVTGSMTVSFLSNRSSAGTPKNVAVIGSLDARYVSNNSSNDINSGSSITVGDIVVSSAFYNSGAGNYAKITGVADVNYFGNNSSGALGGGNVAIMKDVTADGTGTINDFAGVAFFENSSRSGAAGNSVTITGTANVKSFDNSSYDANSGSNTATINNANIDGTFKNLSLSGATSKNVVTINGTMTTESFENAGNILKIKGNLVIDDGSFTTDSESQLVILDPIIGSRTIVSTTNGGVITGFDPSTVSDVFDFIDISVANVNNTLVATGSLASSLQVKERSKQSFLSVADLASKSDGVINQVNSELLSISDSNSFKEALKSISGIKNNMAQISSGVAIDKTAETISNYIALSRASGLGGFSTGNAAMVNPYGIWGQFFGGKGKQDERDGEAGYKSKITGFVLGIDTTFERKYLEVDHIVGGAFSYSTSEVDSDNNFNNDISTYQIALYNHNAKRDNLGLYNENMVNISYNQYDLTRNLSVGSVQKVATAKYGGLQFGVKSKFGYNQKITDKFILSPNVGMKYSRLNQDNYQEEGAGNAGYIVKNKNFNILVSTIGLDAAYELKYEGYDILPKASFAWNKNWKRTGHKSTVAFIAGGDGIESVGASLVKNIFEMNLGVVLPNIGKEGESLSLEYSRHQGDGYSSNSGFIQYQIDF